ncbi:hypothetical protein QEH59_04435 [Coraliomargarita sp. SDUM461004]|uniref:Uncharacterized protein n=1 Tax=Thalassobacterium sedimentorum TaxID=3041258 RepID=A0ABU1AIQ4_9BACT|nr:hypothetical protein [Coraliomargarita sp. SDUM461004]MDQ8193656.1 hypothetical protein [Coraliomargarita sp. SDUM461004]
MKRQLEVGEAQTYRIAAKLGMITGRLTQDDYIAVLEYLEAQGRATEPTTGYAKLADRQAMLRRGGVMR